MGDLLAAKFARVRGLVLDVDGVLTDGRLYYTGDGGESKAFHSRDGLGIKLLRRAGVAVAIISARSSPVVARRAAELGIAPVLQGCTDKLAGVREVGAVSGVGLERLAYMGDDLPDYCAMRAVGLALAPGDAHADILALADWTAMAGGGCGAVREACDAILRGSGQYSAVTAAFRGDMAGGDAGGAEAGGLECQTQGQAR
ncbi:MAG: hypothetical protein GDA55_00045 [Cellvibrionales bacterium]|nr:hypothetical protein [Cellvibrionales bacterium]